MAIETRKKKGGKQVYYWRDRSRGITKSFEDKDKALEYHDLRKRINRDIELGLAVSVDDLKTYTVRHIIISYMKNRPLTKDELDLPLKKDVRFPENVYL